MLYPLSYAGEPYCLDWLSVSIGRAATYVDAPAALALLSPRVGALFPAIVPQSAGRTLFSRQCCSTSGTLRPCRLKLAPACPSRACSPRSRRRDSTLPTLRRCLGSCCCSSRHGTRHRPRWKRWPARATLSWQRSSSKQSSHRTLTGGGRKRTPRASTEGEACSSGRILPRPWTSFSFSHRGKITCIDRVYTRTKIRSSLSHQPERFDGNGTAPHTGSPWLAELS